MENKHNCRYITASQSILGARESQQDSLLIYEHDDGLLAAVCDGMGGIKGGETASKTAVSTLKTLYQNRNIEQPPAEFLRSAADIMDETVYNLMDENGDRLRAGTTVAAVIIEGSRLTWLSVGDSRLYIARGGEMIRATRDHNYFMQINQLRADGKLTEAQYSIESARGESLISYIGAGGLEIADVNNTPFDINPGDRILLTSDGLYKALDDAKIQSVLSEYGANGAVLALTSLAKRNCPESLDNTTCIVIHYINGDNE